MSDPCILFPASTAASYLPGLGFEDECRAAMEAGFHVSFIGPELSWGERPTLKKMPSDVETPIIYRGWILKSEQYKAMEDRLAESGHRLVVDEKAYTYAYHLPNWLGDVHNNVFPDDGCTPVTPRTLFLPIKEASEYMTDGRLFKLVADWFKSGGAILKDYVKSRKEEWWDSCYIPDVTDLANVERVTRNFIKGQAESLVGGLVYRQFIPLKRTGIHPKTKLPLVNEHRIFVYEGEPFHQVPYWVDGDYSGGNKPPEDVVENVTWRLKSPFLTIDVAEREDGRWAVIEIGDGGSSGVPGADHDAFYRALRAVYP